MAHDMGDIPADEEEAFDTLNHVYRHLVQTGQLPIRLFAFTPLPSWQGTSSRPVEPRRKTSTLCRTSNV